MNDLISSRCYSSRFIRNTFNLQVNYIQPFCFLNVNQIIISHSKLFSDNAFQKQAASPSHLKCPGPFPKYYVRDIGIVPICPAGEKDL